MSAKEVRAFSAPGKALIAGGYLVLNAEYKSFVVALSARMHAMVSCQQRPDIEGVYVKVTSTQFNDDEWNYRLKKKNGYVPLEINDLTNPFVEQVIFNVFNYFFPEEVPFNYIVIQTFSDAEYHSAEGTVQKVNEFKEFNFHKKDIQDVPKTGLGSSASLTTVLTTCLCANLMADLDVKNQDHLHMIHNLAQVAHCQAQGKIGSGFDIAAATYGSIVYRRFPPALIADLPTMDLVYVRQYHNALKGLIDRADWNIFVQGITLPPGLKLVMGDVRSGSSTVKLVATVQKWYDNNLPRSFDVFEEINKCNNRVIDSVTQLTELSSTDPERYNSILASINLSPKADQKSIPEITELEHAVLKIRELFRAITKESGADIEPETQTTLLDKCLKFPGVISGVVPGAGGHDAIALLTTEGTDMAELTKGNPDFEAVSWLKVTQAKTGVREEDPRHYENLHLK
ncbi:phosphomevalonate kinase KNAG_0J02060 [Huiozyma naganishii CBS 8797]|uniref:Phosphomevalonate kinase n=1 Tax=Huiozyma naganishii (strain ATCC MYA-139 / BCRC 22969 / CBS 8797 / KCTC 17520 / NBRC 10181 / NCYC 3082 / Yp74L-3) TaxID=1071383 RepID=J7S2X1_HUIN7|nr:hypothetical protein KNAG_0J02060 [Kazachstania naganishii CBS 8797]CCK72287.1 hypothetical protein KNAG_0J02060 [Kazachstania naganishii CBS 8797]